MGARKWVRHGETGAVKDVAASAVAVLAGSGWAELTDAEVEQLHADRRAEKAATEAAMTPGGTTPAPATDAPTPTPSPRAKPKPADTADQTAGTTPTKES